MSDLYNFCASRAQDSSEWYLRDKRNKRRGSQALRIAAVLFGALGGVAPLIQLIAPNIPSSMYGYLFILLAASAVAYDKFFGLSAAWMRDIAASQAIDRHLASFQFKWSMLSFEEHSSGQAKIARKLELAREFGAELDRVVHSETLSWETEFRALIAQLQQEREQAASSTRPSPGANPS